MSDDATNDYIHIYGAREHNLKNIDVTLPRNKLIVVTGLSGSGKSSLAYDTIYAEGQRRYMETFASYARQYMGEMKRPDVEKIDGLSPVISIEQKSINRNPRSTVGTTTEIYDFLRLLYARVSDAYSSATGKKMIKYTEDQVIQTIIEKFEGQLIILLAPKVKGRKGHYRELFENYRKRGFTKVRVDGKIRDIEPQMQVSRYNIHNIEVVVDRVSVAAHNYQRIRSSVQLCFKEGKGNLVVLIGEDKTEQQFFYSKNLMCPDSGISYDEPQPNTFSFNSPYGACPECLGMGEIHKIDRETLILDENKGIGKGGLLLIDEKGDMLTNAVIRTLAKKYNFNLDTPIKDIPAAGLDDLFDGTKEEMLVQTSFLDYEITFSGLIKKYKDILEDKDAIYNREDLLELIPMVSCGMCNGSRLKEEALNFKIDERNISELANMQIDMFYNWVSGVEEKLTGNKRLIATELLKEIQVRTKFILDVGLTYISLNRPIYTLSGGEAQRIRLATQIGSQLINVLYVIDEPSIGLHQRDNHKLIKALQDLRDVGNSVVVVEHDKDMMKSADFIIDLGPGAGIHGGEIIYAGAGKDILKADSITADYLAGRKLIKVPDHRRKDSDKFIQLTGCTGNNLKNVHVKFPLQKLICITGVSGSGKSTLINETLYPILRRNLYKFRGKYLPYGKITGTEHIDKVIEIDQQPIGRTPRSNPATYTGIFTNIRNLYSELQESKIRGYKPGRFSFNVKGGRCEECQGAGVKTIEMQLLPDVYIECPVCMGKRYNRETLEVRYKGHSINDVLNMTINDGFDFFENIPMIKNKLKTLKEVGMGYVHLGQPSTTLSGGEAQRIKLAAELSKKDTGKTLYILDEPTTGLHFEDIRMLMEVLNKLVDRGNTVIVIEHNLDVIKLADHIIDLGPEGGQEGGEIIAEGTPEEIVNISRSFTGHFLKDELIPPPIILS
jgi:excinuclease ABC subunit A